MERMLVLSRESGTVLLTIRESGASYRLDIHKRLADRARQLWTNVMEPQVIGTFFTTQRKEFIKAKIDMIASDPELRYNLTTDRVRRGVLDFVGAGLNWAFGTATQAQVNKLQGAVDAARSSEQAIVHNIRELITTVNQTRLEQRDTRQKLQQMAAKYDEFVASESARWGRHLEGTRMLMLEEYVDSLLWMDAAVEREDRTVSELKQALRAGQLTEGLCPSKLIRDIIRLAEGHALRALPMEWYYENVRVTPIMIKEQAMTFQITLPFTNDRVYQRYSIQAFDVPTDYSGSRVRVGIEPDITMDTASGYWFVPTLCQGHRPQLCRAGPRWRDAYPCERGLITGHIPDREQCVIVSTRTNETTALELAEGTFVIQTLGEDVRLACRGQQQEQTVLLRGVFRVCLDEGCVLSGGRWALHGMVHRYLSAAAQIDEIKVPQLDLVALIEKQPVVNDTMMALNLDFNIKEQNVPRYMDMHDNDGYPEVVIAHHLSWTAIGFIVILCILCIITAVWLYRRRQKIRFFFADAVLNKAKADKIEKAMKYDKKQPELVETVESATVGEVETV